MNLLLKQMTFARLLPRLLDYAYEHGYSVTLGELWRPEWVAKANSKPGGVVGIANSLHCERLAVDLNLFKDGRFLMTNEDHRKLGEFWESLSTEDYKCVWGGRFGDGNHYSIEHGGVR